MDVLIVGIETRMSKQVKWVTKSAADITHYKKINPHLSDVNQVHVCRECS